MKISDIIFQSRKKVKDSNNELYIGAMTIYIALLYILYVLNKFVKVLGFCIIGTFLLPCWLIGKLVLYARKPKQPKIKQPNFLQELFAQHKVEAEVKWDIGEELDKDITELENEIVEEPFVLETETIPTKENSMIIELDDDEEN